MPTATRQLARLNIANGSAAVPLFTVPAGHVTIVKELIVVNTTALSASLNFNVIGGAHTTIAAGFSNVPAGAVQTRETWTVLQAGDVLSLGRSALSSWMVHVSGSELLIVP